MTLIATALKHMLAAGLPADQIVAAVAEMEAAAQPVETPRQARNRRYYENHKRLKASETSEIKTPKASSEKRLKASESVLIQTPLACAIEDNLTTVVLEPNLTSPNYDAPDRAILDDLESKLADAVGAALASKAGAPKLFDLSPILGLLKSGQGPPADLEMDVLPTLRAAAARSSPGSIKTWAYFTGAIREARDRRLTGAPKVIPLEPRHERPDAPSAKRAAREGNYARAFNGALAAAHSREPA